MKFFIDIFFNEIHHARIIFYHQIISNEHWLIDFINLIHFTVMLACYVDIKWIKLKSSLFKKKKKYFNQTNYIHDSTGAFDRRLGFFDMLQL